MKNDKQAVVPNRTGNREDHLSSIKLNSEISENVVSWCRLLKILHRDLGNKLGISRVTLSQIINSSTTSRQWDLSTLCGLSRVFGVPVSTIFLEAEKESGGAPMFIATFGTKPYTEERLAKLIETSLEELDGSTIMAGVPGARLNDIKAGVPEFVAAYLNGKITDYDAADVLADGTTNFQKFGNPFKSMEEVFGGPDPYWLWVKKAWDKRVSEV